MSPSALATLKRARRNATRRRQRMNPQDVFRESVRDVLDRAVKIVGSMERGADEGPSLDPGLRSYQPSREVHISLTLTMPE